MKLYEEILRNMRIYDFTELGLASFSGLLSHRIETFSIFFGNRRLEFALLLPFHRDPLTT